MKRIITAVFISLLLLFNNQQSNALTFEEANDSNKPMVLLIYANWADNIQDIQQSFNNLESKYSNLYNFVTLDIASPDTKEFNKKFHIYPNLPYILLFKDRGKISRYLQKNCILDNACFEEKLKSFAL